ncbi:MAG: hypothetical protein D6748_06525 [Calditrichaeota bacterium]|nr:MAG: hypothetical protein D6748_06525 [Calditrichota bacterium]
MIFACSSPEAPSFNSSQSNVKGITLVSWNRIEYQSAKARNQLNQIQSLGANTLVVIVTAYQQDVTSNNIILDAKKTPDMEAVKNCLEWAISMGFKVIIKPHVNCYSGAWSGMIHPSNPIEWFTSYSNFIMPLAKLADSLDASYFIIGTELGNTIQYAAQWSNVIDQIRSVFSGPLTYAASWDEFIFVPFWEKLDVIGINAYFPVSNRRDASRVEFLSGWQHWLNRLELLSLRTHKNILFTEIGYQSMDGAGMHPHVFDNYFPMDLQEQADLYWAALTATQNLPWLEGVVWWNWLASGKGGPANTDYTPMDKPAAEILYSFWVNQ